MWETPLLHSLLSNFSYLGHHVGTISALNSGYLLPMWQQLSKSAQFTALLGQDCYGPEPHIDTTII